MAKGLLHRRRMMQASRGTIRGIRRNSSASGVAIITTDMYITRDDSFSITARLKNPVSTRRNYFFTIALMRTSAYLEIMANGYYGAFQTAYSPQILNDGQMHDLAWQHIAGSTGFNLLVDGTFAAISYQWLVPDADYFRYRFNLENCELYSLEIILNNVTVEFEPFIDNGQITLKNVTTGYICPTSNGNFLEPIY